MKAERPTFKTRKDRDDYYRAKYYAKTEGLTEPTEETLTLQIPARAVPVLSAAVKVASFGVGVVHIVWHILALMMAVIIAGIIIGIFIA